MTTNDFIIDCTGDACKGDYVQFERAVFTGSYPRAKFSHNEIIEGEIIKDSYGEKSGQHTFTILLKNGEKTRIKGRNLYKNGCKRKRWQNESERLMAIEEKHDRGREIREKKEKARFQRESYYVAGSPGYYYPVCNICGFSDEEMASSERDLVPMPSCGCAWQ